MGLSKSTRIMILLGIDSIFFLIELVIGYAVHSLALVADSFHMLNDVLSLLVGLWAVKVAQEKTSSKMYTYGWQRAETLGALVNGVFLVALCLSIFLEAIQRFVEPQEVSQPMLVLIVGCLGLASNIVGLFLFHDHGHGGHSHGHSHGAGHADPHSEAEHGHAGHSHDEDSRAANETGNVADVLPQNRLGPWPQSSTEGDSTVSPPSDATAVEENNQPSSSLDTLYRHHKHRKTRSRSRTYSSVEDLPVNPASFRRSIIESSKLDDIDSEQSTEDESGTQGGSSSKQPNVEGSRDSDTLLKTPQGASYGSIAAPSHEAHKHKQPKSDSAGGHGHSHDLNMRGVFLHVMGDALGNIGVIASALIIWLTPYSWRFYSDPAISLVITVIILCSAIPLCKAASRILLQAVPSGLSIDDIKDDIEDLPGVVSAHHLHVWQLSDTKLVASIHVQVAYDFKGEGSARYMQLAHAIRECLHEYGIHSSTIQPEFCLDPEHDHLTTVEESDTEGSPKPKTVSKKASKANSLHDQACLLDCGDSCGNDKSCCPVPSGKDKKNGAEGSHHGHNHDHGH
ncbi:cation efflux-like protein 3 [Elsinoe australis]|uniref:Cation efflux-like protein 3 n=1 Tax=Elsinoe australis TaxID=40998 RepID=A0A4U7B286_9PEZI|nr:cation efflux-like protein 3 [Elsinoe australis]